MADGMDAGQALRPVGRDRRDLAGCHGPTRPRRYTHAELLAMGPPLAAQVSPAERTDLADESRQGDSVAAPRPDDTVKIPTVIAEDVKVYQAEDIPDESLDAIEDELRCRKDLSTPLIDAARERHDEFDRRIEAEMERSAHWYQWRYWWGRYLMWRLEKWWYW
jgi:hypothetical protein